jgi:hypothetical protein
VKSWCERWNIKINEGKIQASISPEDLESLRMYYNMGGQPFQQPGQISEIIFPAGPRTFFFFN